VRLLTIARGGRYEKLMGTIARFARIAIPAALLLAAAILVPMKLLDQRGYERVEKLQRELAQIEEANRALDRENESLRLQIRAFHSDPEYIEKVARDELGMVGPDETIYQFPESDKP
jgi:cell division protein FtsB